MPLSFHFPDDSPAPSGPTCLVTLLLGLPSAGKTTLLKHLLHHARIAAVVKDSDHVGLGDLSKLESLVSQKGCVGSSSADDLFSAVQTIVMRSKDDPFEQILVELGGLEDPQAPLRSWDLAKECQLPFTRRAALARRVAVLDASTFLRDWQDGREVRSPNATDACRHGLLANVSSSVCELLAETVELADVLVVNKCDLASQDEQEEVLRMLRTLNEKAEILQTSFGAVEPQRLLPVPYLRAPAGARGAGEGYSWSQTPAEIHLRMPIGPTVKSKDIDFALKKRDFRLGLQSERVVQGELAGDVTNVGDIMFEIEGTGSDRSVQLCLEKKQPGMWSQLWKESDSSDTCGQQRNCLAHKECAAEPEAEGRSGRRFVFQRRRPFSEKRLGQLLRAWQELREGGSTEAHRDGNILKPSTSLASEAQLALRPVLRSKGVCWSDGEPLRQLRWTQAGAGPKVRATQRIWWALLDEEQRRVQRGAPGAEAEFQQALKTWHELGDCRQDLVFIGGPTMNEGLIVSLLDSCLLSDAELAAFRATRLTVPEEEFTLKALLQSLGAEELRDEEPVTQGVEADEDAEFLRSLGVGCNLQASKRFNEDRHVEFEAVD
ncbi:unnamed protein product [Effrenium voratum]|nr:unnamed protein product [Effrenium voratum]